MTDSRSARLRRACFTLAIGAGAWAAVVAVSGGIALSFGPLRISSRNPRNPALIALLGLAVAWALAPAGHRMSALKTEWNWAALLLRAFAERAWRTWISLEAVIVSRTPAYVPPVLASGIALAIVVVGFTNGALVAAGADASGYATHAHLWATGTLRIDQPLMNDVAAEIPREVFAPLAYKPAATGAAIVPVTAPGLPMVMALFEIIGGRDAVFYVVPLMAGGAIGATYLMGVAVAGPWVGLAAAALLATSPSFLFQLTSSPMSDIPVTAWWAAALASLLLNGRAGAGLAGLAAGAAILTRPNLVPLAIVPGLFLARDVWREGSWRGPAAQRALLFAGGIVPACLLIALLFDYWYGSPLNSGYGSFDMLYRWEHLAVNAARYPRWLLESQTPLIALALVVPFVRVDGASASAPFDLRGRAVMLLCFIAAVFSCYAFYLPFDAWWFLRFLLPAYPPLLVLTAAAVVFLARRLPRGLRIAAAVIAMSAAAWHGVQYARAGNTFNVDGERKYATTGRYIAEHLPRRAVLLAMQHSGSARYYSGLMTLHYQWIPPMALDRLIAELRRLGYQPYLLLEDWEEPDFSMRFPGQRTLDALARPPLAELTPGRVRIYEVPNRDGSD